MAEPKISGISKSATGFTTATRCGNPCQWSFSLLLGDVNKAQNTVLTLTMRLAENEAIHMTSRNSDPWMSGIFRKVLPILLEAKDREVATDFLNRYLLQFDDLRFYTFANITYVKHPVYIVSCLFGTQGLRFSGPKSRGSRQRHSFDVGDKSSTLCC
jgi:hypothetical protein